MYPIIRRTSFSVYLKNALSVHSSSRSVTQTHTPAVSGRAVCKLSDRRFCVGKGGWAADSDGEATAAAAAAQRTAGGEGSRGAGATPSSATRGGAGARGGGAGARGGRDMGWGRGRDSGSDE